MFSELLGMLFGQTAADAIRNSKNPPRPWDTSSLVGVACAILGSAGLLLGLLVILLGQLASATSRTHAAALAIIATVGLGCSYFAYHFGRSAPQVTQRHLGLARFGVIASVPGMVVSVVAVVASVVKIFL
jgi:hypothetical protein